MRVCVQDEDEEEEEEEEEETAPSTQQATVGVTNGSYMTYGGRLVRYLVAKRHPL